MRTLSYTVDFTIEFGDAVPLEDIATHKSALKKPGVYLLISGLPEDEAHLGQNVFYIGKAVSETIFSRAKKHVASISGATSKTGEPKTRPGKRMLAFRDRVGKQLAGLYLVPGFMKESRAFQVSCAEEWLIWLYREKHGTIPEANTHVAKDF